MMFLRLALAFSATVVVTRGSNALINTLPDDAFSASSEYGTSCVAIRAKFSRSGWCADGQRIGDWVEVDLGDVYLVDAVSTKASNWDEWVTSYQLSYAVNENAFTTYPVDLIGNTDASTESVSNLTSPFIARYLRFEVLAFDDWPSMKVEAYGSTTAPTTAPAPTTTTEPPTREPTKEPTSEMESPRASTTEPPTREPTREPTKEPTSEATQAGPATSTLEPGTAAGVPTAAPTKETTSATHE